MDKDYDGQRALSDISFSVADGEFLSLLGPSGCGKTTLLRLIGGFETCTNGQLLLDGQEVEPGAAGTTGGEYRLSELRSLPAHERL